MAGSTSRRISPVKVVRLRAGLTLAQASAEAGVHLQAFFLQERGVYPDVLPAIQAWLAMHEFSIPQAAKEYHEYQRQQRRDGGELYGLSILELGPPEGNPVVGLRNQLRLSRMGFAKCFCLHPGLLYRVERGISKSLPGQLVEALKEAGIRETVLEELDFRLKELNESV